MKLTAHHATHGLEGTIRLLPTGEVLHVVFPKGVYRAPAQVNIGGHRFETEFVLETVDVGPSEEVDMRIRFATTAVQPRRTRDNDSASAFGPERMQRDQDSVSAFRAGDGSPMVGNTMPFAGTPRNRHLVRDGLPPAGPVEPQPRAMTEREVRNEARSRRLEQELGREEAQPAPAKEPAAPKKGKRARG